MTTAPTITGISWEDEAALLPFGPAKKQVLLLDVSRRIWAVGGQIWDIHKQLDGSGTLYRANIGTRQFRVIIPILGQEPIEPPTEKGSPCHIATSLRDLDEWLETFARS